MKKKNECLSKGSRRGKTRTKRVKTSEYPTKEMMETERKRGTTAVSFKESKKKRNKKRKTKRRKGEANDQCKGEIQREGGTEKGRAG